MNNFVKMDVAIELMADKISKTNMLFVETGNQVYKNELSELMKEREQIYNCDLETMDKVINVYSKELKLN